MYYQMNHMNMAKMMAEDVFAPELRNPQISGMSKNHTSIAERIVNRLNHLFGQKQ